MSCDKSYKIDDWLKIHIMQLMIGGKTIYRHHLITLTSERSGRDAAGARGAERTSGHPYGTTQRAM